MHAAPLWYKRQVQVASHSVIGMRGLLLLVLEPRINEQAMALFLLHISRAYRVNTSECRVTVVTERELQYDTCI